MRSSKRLIVWGLLLGAVVLGCLELPKAEAYWRYWRLGGPAVWSCGYGGCYDGCWYLGLRPGPIRRLLFGRYRWYYVGPSYCYSPCYVTTCSVCWSTPCCCCDPCCSGAVVSSSMPVEVQQPMVPEVPLESKPIFPAPKPAQELEIPSKGLPGPDTPTPAPPMPGPGQTFHEPTRSDSGLLTLYVPYDAKVFINGLQTRSTGSRRQYVSYGLLPGYRYKYEVRVEIVREGKIFEESKVVYLTAGGQEALAFGFNVRSVEGLAAAPASP